MCNFKVGQRVKLVRMPLEQVDRNNSMRLCIGSTGTVMGTSSQPNAGFNPSDFSNVSICMDTVGFSMMAPSDWFEPIIGPEITIRELESSC